MFDVTDSSNYNLALSGSGGVNIGSPSVITGPGAGDLLTFWDGTKWVFGGTTVQFKLAAPTSLNQLKITIPQYESCIILVDASGNTIGLWSYGFCVDWDINIYRTSSTYIGPDAERELLWDFDPFVVDRLIFARACSQYYDEEPAILFKMEASAPFSVPVFWTNFSGQTELS